LLIIAAKNRLNLTEAGKGQGLSKGFVVRFDRLCMSLKKAIPDVQILSLRGYKTA